MQSREFPAEADWFKETLADGEPFESDFIGASAADCTAWALEHQVQHNQIDQDKVAIVDARSAEDETIELRFYVRDVVANLLRPGQQSNAWYDFRVPYQKAPRLLTDLPYGDADETYGVYFWRRDGLVDERGVFDVEKAEELILQGEGFVPLDEEAWDGLHGKNEE